MRIEARNVIDVFPQQSLEAIAKILGDTTGGLTGSEIQHALSSCSIKDVDPTNTKWKRLYHAFVSFSNKHRMGNHVIQFIKYVMNPASHTNCPEVFKKWQSQLNKVLSLRGMRINDSGEIVKDSRAHTLDEAVSRANRFKDKLSDRHAHPSVIEHCLSEITTDNYFHAVLEAIKSLTVRIRMLSGLDGDGHQLVEAAFAGRSPSLKINSYETETQKGEQRGFVSLACGLYGMIRNPVAHEAKIRWPMSEQDALDIIATVSFIHRKLDAISA